MFLNLSRSVFFVFFYEGKKIIVTNGFRKKQQKLPVQEKENALIKRVSYLKRVKTGEYYD
jgi:phage-related protein